MWKIQDLFFPTHTLCEKLSTFYITIVISLLLQATGNKARNRRRWTEDTWLLFGSQVFSVKRRDHFPCELCLSYPHNDGGTGSAKLRSGTRVTWPFRLIHDLPGNSDHHLPRHTLKPVGENVTGIQAGEEAIPHVKVGKMSQHTWFGRGGRREKDSPGEHRKQTHRGVKIHSTSRQQREPESRNITWDGDTPGGDSAVWKAMSQRWVCNVDAVTPVKAEWQWSDLHVG